MVSRWSCSETIVGTTSSVCSRALEALDFDFDDGFGALRFFLAIGNVRGDHLLQIVDVVDEDAVQLVHLRIDVARHGDIDEEHGTVLRRLRNCSPCSWRKIACGAPVEVMTMSARSQVS